MNSHLSECEFCREFCGDADNSFARIYQCHPKSRVLFRTDEFVVIPSLGQIVEGYLLILPIKHFLALGDLPLNYLDELSKICANVSEILSNLYGPHIFFEHGTREVGVGGCGIYHAHLHALPLAGISDPLDVLKERFAHVQVANLGELGDRSAGLPSYLFYQDSQSGAHLFETGPMPSQYMRKLIADALGERSWDWRTVRREPRLLSTVDHLSSHFAIELARVE